MLFYFQAPKEVTHKQWPVSMCRIVSARLQTLYMTAEQSPCPGDVSLLSTSLFNQPTSKIQIIVLQDIDSYCKAAAYSTSFAYHFHPERGLQADRNKRASPFPTWIHSNLSKWRPTTSSTFSCLLPSTIVSPAGMVGHDLVTPTTRGARSKAVRRYMSARQ